MTRIEYFYAERDISLYASPDDSITVSKASAPITLPPQLANSLDIITVNFKTITLAPRLAAIVDTVVKTPGASLDDIVTALALRWQAFGQPSAIRADLGDLCEIGILAMETKFPRLSLPYPLDHACQNCGCSCQAQLVGPLSDKEYQRVIDAHKVLHQDGKVAPNINPILKGMKPDGTCLHFLHFPQSRCLFLDDTQRCTIHAQFGAMQKPAACRRFPHIAIRTESEIRLGLKPYCYANANVCILDPSDDQAKLTPGDFFDDLVSHADFRPVLRNADPQDTLQAKLQECQILAWLQSNMSYPQLLAQLVRAQDKPPETLPKAFLRDCEAAFRRLAQRLTPDVQKLGIQSHAEHCQRLLAQLQKPLQNPGDLAPDPKFWRYTRYALFMAVFLRETSRFPSVATGTFALALGYLAAIQDPDHASDHLTAWMRLFAQTQAFMFLFDTPQALASLTKHLE